MMKTLCKRALTLCLCLCAALAAMQLPVRAAVQIDTARGCRLHIAYSHAGVPIGGARFDLYRVADVDAYGVFTLSGDFADYPVDVNGLESAQWRALTETLAGYARRDALAPLDSGLTDRSGALTFPTAASDTLRPGLYLVTGQSVSDGQFVYTPEPFLVSLPSPDQAADRWQYDVTAEPKHTRSDVPTPPDGGTVDRRVVKVWNDANDAAAQRPAGVTVYLLKNGVLYDTVILNDANSWRYHWRSLPQYENGYPIDWQVVEEPVDGYTVTVTREGITFVITSTKTTDNPPTPDNPGQPDQPDTPSQPDTPDQPTPDKPTLPQTGSLWWPVPVLAAGGLLCLLCGALTGRRKRHE